MRFLTLVVIVLFTALPSVTSAEDSPPKRFTSDLSERQAVIASQCEKLSEVRGAKLCRPYEFKEFHSLDTDTGVRSKKKLRRFDTDMEIVAP